MIGFQLMLWFVRIFFFSGISERFERKRRLGAVGWISNQQSNYTMVPIILTFVFASADKMEATGDKNESKKLTLLASKPVVKCRAHICLKCIPRFVSSIYVQVCGCFLF